MAKSSLFSALIFLVTIVVMNVVPARACDLCGCYTPQLETLPGDSLTQSVGTLPRASLDQLYAALGEQYTYFGTLQLDGREVANSARQFEESSISQLVVGYSLTSRFALQLNAPLIYRAYRRPEGFAIDRGTESGLGDVSLLLKSVLFHFASRAERELRFDDAKSPVMVRRESDFTASAVLLTGIKFPTGDASRIKEEFHEIELPGAPLSGIHGHDLTLGSGSFDAIFGAQSSLRYRNWFLDSEVQFTLRGDGAHQYHFANDLSWSGGPGYYLIRQSKLILGAQFVVSGEHKDVDRFRGEAADDTGITSVFLGPRLVASYKKISGELGVDLPVAIRNTALQIVPDIRIRAGFSWRF